MTSMVDQGGGQATPDLTSLIRCGRCKGHVRFHGGGAVCANEHTMLFGEGFLDGSAERPDETGDAGTEERTLRSFGYEWTSFDSVQPEDKEFWRRYFADIDLGELADRVAIDVGCGKARYTRFTAEHVKAMVALDGSDAVKSAVKNLRDLPNTLVVKATIKAMPVAAGSFGLVSCLGVLHHLDDPRSGFDRVAELLEPDGILLLYLYSRPTERCLRSAGLAAASIFRRLTIRTPHRLLKAISAPLSAALYCTFVLPGRYGERRGVLRLSALPLSFYRGKPLRSLWLDTFDRLSAPIEHRYVWKEIEPWFAEAGLTVQSVREESGLFIVARRP